MSRPVRFQLSRAPGWKMPARASKCDRSTLLGNPWSPGDPGLFRLRWRGPAWSMGRALSLDDACELHRLWLVGDLGCSGGTWIEHPRFGPIVTPFGHAEVIARLAQVRGRDLGCWCRADARCHGDTLIVLANAGDEGGWLRRVRRFRDKHPLKSAWAAEGVAA